MLRRSANHEQILDFWRSAHERGTLHHAYLLTGPDREAGRSLIVDMVPMLGVRVNDDFSNHPDVALVSLDTTDADATLISVETIRELKMRSNSQSVHRDGWRVFVIDRAERLSTSAANALLKILEEPGSKTIFFLLADNADDMIATIQSRVHTVAVKPQSDFYTAIVAQSTDAADLGRSFVTATAAERFALLDRLFKDETYKNAGKLDALVTVWYIVGREMWMTNRTASLTAFLNGLFRVREGLRKNINAKLLFERLALTL